MKWKQQEQEQQQNEISKIGNRTRRRNTANSLTLFCIARHYHILPDCARKKNVGEKKKSGGKYGDIVVMTYL